MASKTLGSLVLAALLVTAGPRSFAEPAAAQQGAQAQPAREAEARLLGLGQEAPDFTLPLVNGGEVTLGNLLKFGKAVLVCFWAIKPESGGAEMPKLKKLHEQLEGKGLSTIAVNPADEPPQIVKFLETNEIQFLVAFDGKETNRAVTGRYRARTLPTYYLLDPAGKVLWRSIGLKEPALREALEKAGIK